MSDIDDYQDRLDCLLSDAIDDEIDPIDLLVNAIADYLESELADEQDKTLRIELGDVVVVLTLEQPEEENTARLH